jgi:Flp pilus assembly pilin Flp
MRSPFNKKVSFHKLPRNRRGQTLVEYALILAYISVVSMQVLDFLGFAAQKDYVYVNCVAIVANTNNQNISATQNQSNEMTAVNNYLATAFAKYPASWSGPAVTQIQSKMSSIIYGS